MTRKEARKTLVHFAVASENQITMAIDLQCRKAIEMAIKALEQPEQLWIPCSKRLPERNGLYIVSYEDAIDLLDWFNGKWFFYMRNPTVEETGTVFAWMPLPEPWKGDTQE